MRLGTSAGMDPTFLTVANQIAGRQAARETEGRRPVSSAGGDPQGARGPTIFDPSFIVQAPRDQRGVGPHVFDCHQQNCGGEAGGPGGRRPVSSAGGGPQGSPRAESESWAGGGAARAREARARRARVCPVSALRWTGLGQVGPRPGPGQLELTSATSGSRFGVVCTGATLRWDLAVDCPDPAWAPDFKWKLDMADCGIEDDWADSD